MQDFVTIFQQVGLPLEISATPFAVRDDRIFQLTIDPKRKYTPERFRIFYGDTENLIVIVAIDHKYHQLILRVKEPRRRFVDRVYDPQINNYKEIERFTQPFIRNYLMGMDEKHLFISELPRNGAINTVRDAHRILKPTIVLEREVRAKIIRQGEWFFLPLTASEREDLETKLQNMIPQKNVPIGKSRNPHVAELYLDPYVKGKVVHAQHETVTFGEWHRVIQNTELREGNRLKWID